MITDNTLKGLQRTLDKSGVAFVLTHDGERRELKGLRNIPTNEVRFVGSVEISVGDSLEVVLTKQQLVVAGLDYQVVGDKVLYTIVKTESKTDYEGRTAKVSTPDRTPQREALSNILLGPEQEALLIRLVEATRKVQREQREPFRLAELGQGEFLRHRGLAKGDEDVYKGDIEMLADQALLKVYARAESSDMLAFDVTPLGFKHYEQLKQREAEPVARMEGEVRRYLDSVGFQKRYPAAYEKWTGAEILLWGDDSTAQLSTIGHLCRESMQEFAAALIEEFKPTFEDKAKEKSKEKAKTVIRIRAVLDQQKGRLGSTEIPFLDALLAYWGTVSDLVQRQEHAGERETEPLMWADAGRVVMHTAMVMFEIDGSLHKRG